MNYLTKWTLLFAISSFTCFSFASEQDELCLELLQGMNKLAKFYQVTANSCAKMQLKGGKVDFDSDPYNQLRSNARQAEELFEEGKQLCWENGCGVKHSDYCSSSLSDACP